ncbi:glycine oxidase ThiO [Roseovarius sp. LXJ103]|uniref:glycine oxidase ThiO n=1 Tax=Roseovarius carneus TaxID=2853164 RepID=UPI000D605112|nr:glycine oxidase ThiO [Roseovarius carneus]MBZ8118309.1 glycine oxidase ThiO [Roseovarius carneus]PWE35971.1 glycine oxidase ThiO [Pelagicola sp. LXJ1103]
MEITIIGAGVTGLAVARALRDRGADLRIVERGDGAAPGPQACSWWAGGMLAPHCEGESAEEPVVRLGQEAAGWWEAATGCVTRAGSLVVSPARDQADLRRFSQRTSGFEPVDEAQIAALEPDLEGRFTKGLYFPSEAHLDPRAALTTLRTRLEAEGVAFETREADPTQEAKRALTIDCRGLSARAAMDGLRGVKGEMLVLRCPDVALTRPIRLLHPRIPLYIVPRGEGLYMLGATMIEAGAGKHPSARALLELLSGAYALNPAFGEAEVLEIGVDARPAFADNLPRISRKGRLISVNGLYRHGFLLAPAMARMVAAMLYDETTPEVLHEDRVKRRTA